MNNKKIYIEEVDKIQPSEELIQRTIKKVKEIEYEKKSKRVGIFSIFQKIILGILSFSAVGAISFAGYVAISKNTEMLKKIGVNVELEDDYEDFEIVSSEAIFKQDAEGNTIIEDGNPTDIITEDQEENQIFIGKEKISQVGSIEDVIKQERELELPNGDLYRKVLKESYITLESGVYGYLIECKDKQGDYQILFLTEKNDYIYKVVMTITENDTETKFEANYNKLMNKLNEMTFE